MAASYEEVLEVFQWMGDCLYAQVPVSVSSMRSVWQELVEQLTLVLPVPVLTVEEIKQGFAMFNCPFGEHCPIWIQSTSTLKEIVKDVKKAHGVVDSAMALRIIMLAFPVEEAKWFLTDPADLQFAMQQFAKNMQEVWKSAVESIKHSALATAAIKVFIPQGAVLEPDFQKWLDYYQELFAAYRLATDFAITLA